MSKDAYYFSHDSNARNDQRLMKVRMKYGMEGYGIYFGLIEILREQKDYTLNFDDIESIAYGLMVDLNKVEDIVSNFNLFHTEGDLFYSKSLKRRMEKLDLIKEKRAEAGRLGGKSKANAKAKVKQTQASKVKQSKVNNSKVNKSKELNIDFSTFWNLYDYKKGDKIKLQSKWESFTDDVRQQIIDALPNYIASTPEKKYRKHPQTYLNNKSWEDEIIITANAEDFKLDSTGMFYKGYCDKCNKSDFYEERELSGESRCCNSRLTSRRRDDSVHAIGIGGQA